MKSFLYFFCGTSVHYERRFLLICSTTRKVRTYIWKLDFLINLRALERERWKGCWSLFLISWYLVWNCFHIFVHTKKQNLCFCLSPLVSRGLYMYSQFHPHTRTTLSFPPLFIFFHSWTPGRKERLCKTCDDHEVKVGCYFLCNNGCLRSYHCSLGIANGKTRNTQGSKQSEQTWWIEIDCHFQLYSSMFIGSLLFMLSQWTS